MTKRHFFLLTALLSLCLIPERFKAADYTISYGSDNGAFYIQNGMSVSNQYAAYWLSTQTSPQVKVFVVNGYNNIDNKNIKGALYVGRLTSPYGISVSEGFVITGYTITGKAISDDQTITPSEGGEVVTFTSSAESTVKVEGLRTESTTFILAGANTGLEIISFQIFVDVDAERTADLAAHYESAMSALTSGNRYWISTSFTNADEETIRYFLNVEGSLTSDFADACPFTLSQVTAQSTFRPVGWQATDVAFSSPYIQGGNQMNVNHIMTNIGENRNDWEAQVYLRDDDGHYAIRATNINSAENFANTYWAVTDINCDGVPEANYTEERAYVWDVTPYNAAKEASILLYKLVEDAGSYSVGACDATTAAHFYSLLEQSIQRANPSFDSDSHSEECITLLSELRTAYDGVRTSVAAYCEYQAKTDKARQTADNCTIADSPLALELDALATHLQTSIDNGNVATADFLNLDSYISDRQNYWSRHFEAKEKVVLGEVLNALGEQTAWTDQWNLEAEETVLDGVTITEGTITGISLADKGLTGVFPASTFTLPHLTFLDLSGNSISDIEGAFPSSITDININGQVLSDEVQLDLPTVSNEDLLAQLPPIIRYNQASQGKTTEYGFYTGVDGDYLMFHNLDGHLIVEYPPKHVYRQKSGDVLTFTCNYGDAEGTTFPVRITFEQGDASFDGVIDVTDLQAIVNYIFDEQEGCFNFTAANLWEDERINVQDVVKEVDLLFEHSPEGDAGVKAHGPRKILGQHSSANARVYIAGGNLVISTDTPIAALDITINATAELDMTALQALGFSVSKRSTANGIRIIAYSLNGAEMPLGETAIATITAHNVKVEDATLSDSAARHIAVALNKPIATGLESAISTGQIANEKFYDVSGRRIVAPDRSGVYIRDGRKIFVK